MPSKTLDIPQLLKEHNTAAMAKFLLYAVLTPLLWWFSYWAVWWIAFMLPGLFAGHWMPNAAHGIAAVMMVLLLIDAYRNGRELFDLEHYRSSRFSADIGMTGLGYAHGVIARPTTTAYVAAQCIMAAPRVNILAIRHFRERVHLNERAVQDAAATAKHLLRHGKWEPVSSLKTDPDTLTKLELMGVIWLKLEQGALQARIDPGFM